MAKLSKKQAEVIGRMAEGWECGVTSTMDGRIWLQKNGLGKGGETMAVHRNTFNGLYLRKLIKQKAYGFPSSVWVLTDAGQSAAA